MPSPDPQPGIRLTRRLMAVLTLIVFASAGCIHFQTPLLGKIAAEFNASPAVIGWIPTLTFAGFFAGTLLVVPLGDRYDKRRIILTQCGVLVASLLITAAAPALWVIIAASFVTGICCGVSHHIVPIVSEFGDPDQRGRLVGTVLSGVFTGLMYSRVMAGLIGERFDWRWAYVVGAAVLGCILVAAVFVIPRVPPKSKLSYLALLRSVAQVYAKQPQIRHPSAAQFFLGICYGGFWATAAGMLLHEYGYGPAVVGLIGIPGAAGILVARPAGKWMDRKGIAPVVRAGIALVIAAYLAFFGGTVSVGFILAGVVLMDCGLRATMVANQTQVAGVLPEARSRSMTIFAAHVWSGNAVGAYLASLAYAGGGWAAMCALGVGASLVSFAIAQVTNKPKAGR